MTSYATEELTSVWLLMIVVIVITYVIQRNQWRAVPASSCAMGLGIVAGVVLRLLGMAKPLRFSPGVFFYGLLPPVVFAAGFTLKKREFFRNLGAILTYAILGTLISAVTFGLATYSLYVLGVVRPSALGASPLADCLMYGAAISSIDPVATLAVLADLDVPPLLYNLVFGESVLNDAVAITLFRAIASAPPTQASSLSGLLRIAAGFVTLGIGSFLVGVTVALAAAFVLRHVLPMNLDDEGDRAAAGGHADLSVDHFAADSVFPRRTPSAAAVGGPAGPAGRARGASPPAPAAYPRSASPEPAARAPGDARAAGRGDRVAAGEAGAGGTAPALAGGELAAARGAPPAAAGGAPRPPAGGGSGRRAGGHDRLVYELAIVIMGSYLAYLLAEVAGLSGIVSLFFAGVCHAHYAWYDVSPAAQVTLRALTEFAAFVCETFVMLYLGLQVATTRHAADAGLILSALPLAALSRAANVFPCSRLINAVAKPGRRLPRSLQTMLWAAGLRGAVAYGLIINMPSPVPSPPSAPPAPGGLRLGAGEGWAAGAEGFPPPPPPPSQAAGDPGIPAVETATLFIVVVSTFVLGSATTPLLGRLGLLGKDDATLHRQAEYEAGLDGSAVQPLLPLAALNPWSGGTGAILGSGPLSGTQEGQADEGGHGVGRGDGDVRGDGGARSGAPPRPAGGVEPSPGPLVAPAGAFDADDEDPHWLHDRFKELDEAVLKPLFGGAGAPAPRGAPRGAGRAGAGSLDPFLALPSEDPSLSNGEDEGDGRARGGTPPPPWVTSPPDLRDGRPGASL